MKTRSFICMLALVLGFAACEKAPDPTLTVVPATAITFSAENPQDVVIAVSTNQADWTVVSDQSWCSVVKGEASFTVSALPNTTSDARTAANITVSAGAATPVVLQANQAGLNITLAVDPIAVSEIIPGEGGVVTFTVTSNSSAWEVVANVDWITFAKGATTVAATLAKNLGDARNAAITFTAGNATPVTIIVSQAKGASTLTITPGQDEDQYFGVEGGTFTIEVVANGEWEGVTGDSWVVLSKTSGTGNATITATVLPNTGFAADKTYVDFYNTCDEDGDGYYDNETFFFVHREANDLPDNIFFEGFDSSSEDFSSLPAEWTAIDTDGDGNGWSLYDGCLTSASFDNATGALTPDNWVIIPTITLPENNTSLVWNVYGQDGDWNEEHYSVYIGTTAPTTAEEILASYTHIFEGDADSDENLLQAEVGPNFTITVDIPESMNGQQLYVAFRHHDITDMFRINIDYMMIVNQ